MTSKFNPAMKLLSSFRESRRFNFSNAVDFAFFDNEFNGHHDCAIQLLKFLTDFSRSQ